MTPAARLHLAGNLRRSALNTREAVIDHLVATGAEALLAAIDATPAATTTLLPIVGGKPAEDPGTFSISDPAFGDLDLTPEPDGRWRAFHMSWHGDHAGHVGAGMFAHRLDGLLAVLRFAHDATADRLSRQPKPSHPNNFSPDGSAA
jgi:hypothetical protein